MTGTYIAGRLLIDSDGKRLGASLGESGCLQITRLDDETISFGLALQPSAHSCWVSGVARLRDGAYEFEDPYDPELGPCRLRLHFSRSEIEIEDVGGRCRPYHCGVNAQLDTIFSTKSRAPSDFVCQEPRADLETLELYEDTAERMLREMEEEKSGSEGVR
jgi:hypothetical protein